MPRFIDADLIKSKLQKKIINSTTAFINTILIGLLDDAPTADVVEVKHGEWEAYGLRNPKCSICRSYNIEKSRYCPNCGAKMDGTPKERGGEK